ncbi:hypothetical protein [Streptomyces sp. NPDC093598]|uniref:hypothetical protein n=1 Tax=Streptomyces sp. NPDC093598 TaxID=3366046 RepID=UPI0037FA8A58
MPRHSHVAAALLGSALSFMTSACSLGPQPADAREEISPSPAPRINQQSLLDPLPDLVLPVQEYMETESQRRRVSQARQTLINACLKSKRAKYRMPSSERVSLPSLMAGRYGPTNDAQSRYGYHFMMALGDGGASAEAPLEKEKAVVGNCSRKASEEVPSFTDNGLTDQIKQFSYVESMKLPEVSSVFGKWSDCMSSVGFTYKTPMDAMRDPRWDWKSAGPSKSEVSVAIRDAQCKQKFNVAQVWFQGEVEIQNKELTKRKKALEGIRMRLEERDATVRGILERS